MTESASALADKLFTLGICPNIISDEDSLLDRCNDLYSENTELTARISEVESEMQKYKSAYSRKKQETDDLRAQILQLQTEAKQSQLAKESNQSLINELAKAKREIAKLQSLLEDPSISVEDLYQGIKSLLQRSNPSLFSSPAEKHIEIRVSSKTQGQVYAHLLRKNGDEIYAVNQQKGLVKL
jgi:chromosome segregation ATPase